jgi:antitoxin (DNA-binding transcriptional repressor) of toxin-antitoxin stability system
METAPTRKVCIPMPETISVTEAARNFSDVINRVYYQSESYLLTRGGTVVAQLTVAGAPLTGAEWLRRWQERPRLDVDDATEWEDELAAAKSTIESPTEKKWAS